MSPGIAARYTSTTKLMDLINGSFVQTALYVTFMIVFLSLTGCMRDRDEFWLDKHVMDRIVQENFDSSHNTFESIRRTSEIYEWGNRVLWPGLFGDTGLCEDDTCTGEAWPDGEGDYHGAGATPFSVSELVERMDTFDWSEGISIRQGRSRSQTCSGVATMGACYPDIQLGEGATSSYGYNWTHPSEPPLHPYHYMTAEELGSNPAGVKSAAFASQKMYDADGYTAVVIPFFSDTYLPYEEGLAQDVTDIHGLRVTPNNGRVPRYYCVRTSVNSVYLKQQCDPSSDGMGNGMMTGAVRQQVEAFWNDLKRGHFIDVRTRVLTITLQLRNNFEGLRHRMTLMFELNTMGSIITSYDVETRPLNQNLVDGMGLYLNVGLGMIIFFCIMEFVEVKQVGLKCYCRNVWNVVDWTNYILYFVLCSSIQAVYSSIDAAPYSGAACLASNYMCVLGYYDDWKVMSNFRNAKTLLSLCMCIQFFKVVKYAEKLVPKLWLASAVMRKALSQLVFILFTITFVMLGFSMMLYIQLGPVMSTYIDTLPSFVALTRAIMGDFDMDELLRKSSGHTMYLNLTLFLGYLFTNVFIMLSLFLAILAESQVKVRDDEGERCRTKEYEAAGGDYGILSLCFSLSKGMAHKVKAKLRSHWGSRPPIASSTVNIAIA